MRSTPKAVVGQHQLIRSFLPSLIMVVLATCAVLLGFGLVMERELDGMVRALAMRVSPGSHVSIDLDLAVGQFAVARVLEAETGDGRGVTEAKDGLDSAARAYDGWASAVRAKDFHPVAPAVAHFEERVAAADLGDVVGGAHDIDDALDEIDTALRNNRRALALAANTMLEEIAVWQHRRRWEEMGVMALLAGACLALMLAARRREERTCAFEADSVHRLEQVNADLEAFAGRVAHDLRSPLVPILSGSQVIERSDVNAQVKTVATRIERSARRLSSMIDMLLDFSRIVGGQQTATTPVAPIVAEVVDGFRDKARAQGVTIEVSCEDVVAACEPIVVASPLQNLIENAFKYGRREGSSPVIEIRAFCRGGMIIIEVEDRGPGIDAAQAESLFVPFRRSGEGGEGVGLGLATARRLIEARGGSIGLRVGRVGGALFQVRLPAAPSGQSDAPDVTGGDVHA